MIAALAFVSRWFFAGGWKFVLAAIVAGYLYFLYLDYQHAKDEAAKVPVLSAQIEGYKKADAARQQADADLSKWQSAASDILNNLRKASRNAAVAINPVCAPSDTDRSLRNDALNRLLSDAPGSPD